METQNLYVVEYGASEDSKLKHWNCGDSFAEAQRVYDYMRYIHKYARIKNGDDILKECTTYDDGIVEVNHMNKENDI